VVKLAPVNKRLPPVAASYQFNVPGPVAVNVAWDPGQTVVPETVGGDGAALTVTVTGVRALAHPIELIYSI
jgi:hypothetical protein